MGTSRTEKKRLNHFRNRVKYEAHGKLGTMAKEKKIRHEML